MSGTAPPAFEGLEELEAALLGQRPGALDAGPWGPGSAPASRESSPNPYPREEPSTLVDLAVTPETAASEAATELIEISPPAPPPPAPGSTAIDRARIQRAVAEAKARQPPTVAPRIGPEPASAVPWRLVGAAIALAAAAVLIFVLTG